MVKNILIFMILFVSVSLYGQPDNLKNRDSIPYNSFISADLFPVMHEIGGVWKWYKASWYALSFGVRNVIRNQSNTWVRRQIFNGGATFNGATYGTVIFNDTVYCPNYLRAGAIRPLAVGGGAVGSYQEPYYRMYSQGFVVVDETQTDSASINYEDGKFIFDKPIVFSDSSMSDIGSTKNPIKTVRADSIIANYNLVLKGNSIGQHGSVEIEGLIMLDRYYTSSNPDTFINVTTNVIEINESVARTIYVLNIGDDFIQNSKTLEVTILVLNSSITFKGNGGVKNAMRLPGETDITVPRYGTIKLIYAPTIERWLLSGGSQ